MRILALVTARGGSKGFPRKNLAPLAGRSLVGWAHRTVALFRARHDDVEIRLSTDSQEIADLWPEEDRPALLRPAELAQDDTASIDVALYEAAQTNGQPFEAVLLLQPTSPLIDADDLGRARKQLAMGWESIIGAAPVAHPLPWCIYRRDGAAVPCLIVNGTQRRQEHEQAYVPVGFYLATVDFLRRHRSFMVAGMTRIVQVDEDRSIDIDSKLDLAYAEAQLKHSKPQRTFSIGGRRIGGSARCFIIAEAGVNHNGDLGAALALIDAAVVAGADAIKFQAFSADDLVTADAAKAAYQQTADADQRAMLKRLELPPGSFRALKQAAEVRGIGFLCSAFDKKSADMLYSLGVDAYKLGSGEITDHALLAHIAFAGKPMIVSTGMSTLDEIEAAADVIRGNGDPPVAWLHCVSAYPAPNEAANIRAMDSMRLALGGPVGFSDHTQSDIAALAAVARGASIIEKHITISRCDDGPDHAASLEPSEFAQFVQRIRDTEAALGSNVKEPQPCEADVRIAARKSLVATRDMQPGTILQAFNLCAKRPGTGLSPALLGSLLGRRTRVAIAAETPITRAAIL